MLNKYDYKNIEIIRLTAQKVFGENHTFGEMRLLERPYTEFYLPIRLYSNFDVTLEYERSTVGIVVKTAQGLVGLSRLTDEQVFKGLKSSEPENLLHNFQVLDRVIQKLRASQ